ncbi:Hypothetical protein CINCED_3A023846 [Cinara cedri]|nr:Hypothetical protein CINCED_3A023846 [Cinara cedri]
MFSLSQADTYVPRALLVDTEPTVIDTIKTGNYQKLFPNQNMINDKENAASNYAAGFYGIGKKLSSAVMNQLSCLAENCNALQGIALFRSTGGGTGSGMSSRIINDIKDMYPSKTIIDFNICTSSEMSPIIVEPYNTALGTCQDLDSVKCSFLFDNKTLYNICGFKLDIPKPTYRNINNVIALVTSGITSSLRFEGSMMNNLSELLTNLIPYPRLHFPLITHVPISNNAQNISSASTQLAALSFDHNYQMTKIDSKLGKYLSICMMYRGNLTPTDINTAIAFAQREHTIPVTKNINSPLFKFGLCYLPPLTVPSSGIVAATRTVTNFSNNTAIKQYWINLMKNYNKLLSKRVFVHHFTGEGMEEEMFSKTTESISKLIAEYEEIENL